ncbi:MAG TPA: hypothetical protein VF838_13695 [Trebonia sp.]
MPLGKGHDPRRHELQVAEESADLAKGAEPDPAEPFEHVLLQFGGGRVAGVKQVMDEHVAAGRQRAGELGHQPPRVVVVKQVVQDAAQQQADRLAPVEVRADRLARHDRRRLAQVTLLGERQGLVAQDGTGVRQHHGVVVHVDHPGARRGPAGDLVDVVRGGQARADVEQLPDADLAHQVADRPAEHVTLRLYAGLYLGEPGDDPHPHCPVCGEVVLPAEEVVIDPRHMGTRGIKVVTGRFGAHERNRIGLRRQFR